MTTNATEQREHLRRAYRDLAAAEQNLRHSIEALRAAGWRIAASEQQRTAAAVENAMDEIAHYSRQLGGEL